MSFRKRNVGLSSPSAQPKAHVLTSGSTLAAGVRPSPLDGRAITSTGTPSLDDLLGGHAGLALGHSILVEESGPTEFGGVLLRCYAAEGIVQGHKVHVVGVGEQWGRELPGLVEPASSHAKQDVATPVIGKEKMKIAWRYERLRDFGASPPSARGGTPLGLPFEISIYIVLPIRHRCLRFHTIYANCYSTICGKSRLYHRLF